MSIDVVTDLLGEVIEIYEWHDSSNDPGYSLRGRGAVRAVYVSSNQLHVLVDHNLGAASATFSHRTQDGGLEVYSLHDGRARVVQYCARCASWEQKLFLWLLPDNVWEHKSGEGCKKVGHGG